MSTPVLEVDQVTKRFPGVTALHDVDFTVEAGEAHVLLGENGAGKSTLAHVITGILGPDHGVIRMWGEPVDHHSRHQAREIGVEAVFQEFSLVPTLTVAENLYLGRERVRLGFLDRRSAIEGARAMFDRLGFDVDPRAAVAGLSRGEQQIVEIAKALLSEPQILVLDEPTSALGEADAERLFDIIAELKASGVGLVYITHRMREIRKIGDRVTVLRDGENVATKRLDECDDDRLVELMAGRKVSDLYPPVTQEPGPVTLRLEHVTTADRAIEDVSIDVRAGEIVGVAGLVGAGKSEVARAAFGVDRMAAGSVVVKDHVVPRPTPRKMLERGVCYLPGDRRTEGLVMSRPVIENLSLASLGLHELRSHGVLRTRRERARTREMVEKLDIRTTSLSVLVSMLSGGNQQKVMFGRVLLRDLDMFIFEEPTTGIDVGSRAQIYRLLKELCEAGKAILLISSDLTEILHLCERAYVIHRGRVRAHLAGDELTETAVLASFFEVGAHEDRSSTREATVRAN